MLLTYVKTLLKLLVASIRGRIFFNYQPYAKYFERQSNRGVFKATPMSHFAIIIQGQFVLEDNFTLETIKLYRHNFPLATLILSTWTLSEKLVEEINKYDIHIIQNRPPNNPGISNINLQITTSGAGVTMAKALGAKFALKTRTDQRIYHPSLDTYLANLLEAYPLAPNRTGQIKRLVAVSLNTFKYRMYGVSDMFLFGHIDDMVRYWNIPLDQRKNSLEEQHRAGNTWRTFSTWRVCEVYLCTEYLKSIGRDITYTLADSFLAFKDHFVIIDKFAIKLYWHKYSLSNDRYSQYGFFDPELGFNDWLVLYQSLNGMTIDESIIDEPMSRSI